MGFGQFPAHLHELRTNEAQSASFQTGYYLPNQRTLHAIRFYQYKRSFHRVLQH
jgi:hypothetical protein